MKHYAFDGPFKMRDSEGTEYTLSIFSEDCPEDPRDWTNLCTMVCWHGRYALGDRHEFVNPSEFLIHLYEELTGKNWEDDYNTMDWQEIYGAIKETNLVLIKEVNMYEHGGITVSTSSGYPYNDRWDAGIVGFIYVTKKRVFEECSGITEENWLERADHCLESEMETYDQYVRGDVYGYKLTKKAISKTTCPHCGETISENEVEEDVDGCWGYYGDCLEDNGILNDLSDLKFIEEV